MRLPIDHGGGTELLYQEIGARAPQFDTFSTTPASASQTPSSTNTDMFFEPRISNTTVPTQASHDNSRAVKTIIEYFFLILTLFIATILIFRRVFYLRKGHRRDSYTHNQGDASLVRRPFPRTTGLPRFNMRGYPIFDSYFLALPLPAAYGTSTRRTNANDIDLDGRRLTSAGAEVDHDGFLRDKDVLPKYDTSGGPPKYADLDSEQQQALDLGTAGSSDPVLPPPPPAAQSLRNGGS